MLSARILHWVIEHGSHATCRNTLVELLYSFARFRHLLKTYYCLSKSLKHSPSADPRLPLGSHRQTTPHGSYHLFFLNTGTFNFFSFVSGVYIASVGSLSPKKKWGHVLSGLSGLPRQQIRQRRLPAKRYDTGGATQKRHSFNAIKALLSSCIENTSTPAHQLEGTLIKP